MLDKVITIVGALVFSCATVAFAFLSRDWLRIYNEDKDKGWLLISIAHFVLVPICAVAAVFFIRSLYP